MSISAVVRALRTHQTFLICTHINPDPDALASQVGLGLALRQLGKDVIFISEEKTPERFLFLPGMAEIQALGRRRKVNYDAVIITDAGDLERIGDVRRLLRDDRLVINIDHHITNTQFGDINYVLPEASSTCEVVFEIFKLVKVVLTEDLATLLYAGVMTDTGSFRFSNTSARTHRMAAELLSFPLNVAELYKKIYEQVPLTDIKYFTQVISGFTSLNDGKLICVDLPRRIFKKFSMQFDLRHKIFSYLSTIEGVEVLVIFTEEKRNLTRVNFRSQGQTDVALIASKFLGGGHSKASGCAVAGDIKSAHRRVLPEVKKYLQSNKAEKG